MLEHVFSGRHRRRFPSVQTSDIVADGVVDGHVESAAQSGALRVDDGVAKEGGDRRVDRVTSFRQNVT